MKFYGQVFQNGPVDKFLYENHFKEKRNGFFIECGAADGFNLSSCKFFEEFMGWKGINIEASPDKYAKLVQNRPTSFLNLNKGLLHEPGTFVFRDDTVTDPTRFPGWGNGSFEHTLGHYTELQRMGIRLQESQIECITYKQLIESYNVAEVDLFVLDVEGIELKVIEGMMGSRVLPTYMFVEHEHVGLQNTVDVLSSLNYKLVYSDSCNSLYTLTQ